MAPTLCTKPKAFSCPPSTRMIRTAGAVVRKICTVPLSAASRSSLRQIGLNRERTTIDGRSAGNVPLNRNEAPPNTSTRTPPATHWYAPLASAGAQTPPGPLHQAINAPTTLGTITPLTQ